MKNDITIFINDFFICENQRPFLRKSARNFYLMLKMKIPADMSSHYNTEKTIREEHHTAPPC